MTYFEREKELGHITTGIGHSEERMYPRYCEFCGTEVTDDDPFYETSICEECAEYTVLYPTEKEEKQQLSDDDYRRRVRELSAEWRSLR